MSVVQCPNCKTQLDISQVAPATVVACPCGAQIQTPASPMGHPQQTGLPPASNPALGNSAIGNTLQNMPSGNVAPGGYPQNQALNSPHSMPPGQYPQNQTGATYGAPAANDQAYQDTPLTTRQRIRRVNLGIQFVFYGTLGQLAVGFGGGMALGMLPLELFGFLILASTGAIIAGYVLSLFAPEESNSRGLVLAALILSVIGGVITQILSIAFAFMSFESALFLTNMFGFCGRSLPIVSVALYLFFLKAMAQYSRDESAAEQANTLAIQLLAISGSFFVIGFFVFGISLATLIISTIVTLAFLIAYVVWIVQFLRFLDELKFVKRTKSSSGSSSNAGWSSQR